MSELAAIGSNRAASSFRAPVSPVLLSTWSFGMKANAAGWPVLSRGGDALDAVEQACRAVEADPEVDSVGLGGLPDASGQVSLDGCVMLSPQRCAGVCFVRGFNHPVSIARGVMEKTHHVLLAGQGAEAFAAAEGFPRAELLTDHAAREWERWRADPASLHGERYRGWIPPRNVEELRGVRRSTSDPESLPHNRRHDTVGVLAIDARGILAGACSTSGMAFKLPGRVGDSPILGHGLYVVPSAGAAVATGTGELFMRTSGCFLAVERLRLGDSPQQAAVAVIDRIRASCDIHPDHQAAIIVLAPDGAWSAAALRPGFRVAVRTNSIEELRPAPHVSLLDAATDAGNSDPDDML